MLRRKPTALTLTAEDVAIYEDTRAREAQQAAYEASQAARKQQKGHHQGNNTLQNKNPNKAEERVLRGAGLVKTREERLGIAGNGGRS